MIQTIRATTKVRGSATLSRFAYPLLAVAAIGYSVVAIELAQARALPMPAPFLRIADDSYFFWGTFFYAPVIVAAWFLASGAIYLMTRAAGATTAFNRLLHAMAFATGLGTMGTLIPDLVTSPLRALGIINELSWEQSIAAGQGGWFIFTWATLIVYLVLFVVAYPYAVRSSTGVTWAKAAVIGVAGFAIFQGFEYIFIR